MEEINKVKANFNSFENTLSAFLLSRIFTPLVTNKANKLIEVWKKRGQVSIICSDRVIPYYNYFACFWFLTDYHHFWIVLHAFYFLRGVWYLFVENQLILHAKIWHIKTLLSQFGGALPCFSVLFWNWLLIMKTNGDFSKQS